MRRRFPFVSTTVLAGCLLTLAIGSPAQAQEKPKPAPQAGAAAKAKPPAPSAAEQAMMDAMMKAATPGENHKLLASLNGNWACLLYTSPSPRD